MRVRVTLLRRNLLLAGGALVLILASLVLLGERWAERRVAGRIVREAEARGFLVTLGEVRVGLFTPLTIGPLRVEKPGSWSVAAESVRVTLRVFGRGLVGRTRVALGPVVIKGPGGFSVAAKPSRWKVLTTSEGSVAAELEAPAPGALALKWLPVDGGARVEALATDLPAAGLFEIRRGVPLFDAGIVGGALHATASRVSVAFDADLRSRGFRAAALTERGDGGPPDFAPPTDAALRFEGAWNVAGAHLEVPHCRVETDGVVASGSLVVDDAVHDPRIEGTLEVEHMDFGRVLASAGLDPPDALASRSSSGSGDMGSASLSARFSGRIADPASFVVTQKLAFTPPHQPVPAIERLRGDFTHEVMPAHGPRRTIDLSPRSPDFIAFDEVPSLFVKTLLLGEDSGFYGHAGLDLSELPSAILTNWARGDAARGASTISQQLAKNLFLSRDKRMGRKLQELSLALLLEARLGKQRILEIYLNVIEWGPDLYGLRPAARRYFDQEPRDLRPSQMALLVSLIPGPVKYQRSLASGHPSPGFRPLVNGLLAKLRSVDALDDEAYEAALADDLAVRTDPSLPVDAGSPETDDATPLEEP